MVVFCGLGWGALQCCSAAGIMDAAVPALLGAAQQAQQQRPL